MVKSVQVYVTSDGKKFDSEQEAIAHEGALKFQTQITEFVDRHFPAPAPGVKGGPVRAIAARVLALYLSEQEGEE